MFSVNFFSKNKDEKNKEGNHKTQVEEINERIAAIKSKITDLNDNEEEIKLTKISASEMLASKQYRYIMSYEKNLQPLIERQNQIVIERLALREELIRLEQEILRIEKSSKQEPKDDSLLSVCPERTIESTIKNGKFFKSVEAFKEAIQVDNERNIQEGTLKERFNNIFRL